MTRCYHGILVGLESVPSDEDAKTFAGLTEITSGQKKKFNNYKLNNRAYADLLQSCTQDIVSFGIVDAVKDKELSNGNSTLAWKRSTAIATIATKRAIKKLIAGQNSGTMPQRGRGIRTCDDA